MLTEEELLLEEQLLQCVTPERVTRFDEILSARTDQITLVIDNIYHKHNFSAVLRTADAFGIQDIYFVGKRLKTNVDVSLGAEKWLSVHVYPQAEDAVQELQALDYQIVALEPPAPSETQASVAPQPISSLESVQKTALIFGNEKSGISPAFRERASQFVFLPMVGFVESFNISVAAALALQSLTIDSEGHRKSLTPLADLRKRRLRFEWLKREVKGATVLQERIKRNLQAADPE